MKTSSSLRVVVMLVLASPACQWLSGIDDRKVGTAGTLGSDASGSGGAVGGIDSAGSGGIAGADGGDAAIVGIDLGAGGIAGTGGAPALDGGTGGATGLGGAPGTGGKTGAGGASGSGGIITGVGGTTRTGGTTGRGGATGSGGGTGSGGISGQGGATSNGGAGSGGAPGTGGTIVNGGAGGRADAGGQGGRCEETINTCSGDLSNVGTGDFEIKFTLTTSATVHSEVLNQRSVCNHSFFWDIQLKNGTLQVEFDDNNQHYTTCQGTTLVNDGKPHRVVSRRAGGKVMTYVDCVLDSMCACATDFSTTLAPLRATLTGCSFAISDLVGAPSEVCVSSSNVDAGAGGAGGAGDAGDAADSNDGGRDGVDLGSDLTNTNGPFSRRIVETATTFSPSTDGTWLMADYDGDGVPDLVFIRTSNTGTAKVEVHIASAASNFQTPILHTGTWFAPETDGAWLMADYDGNRVPDLIFIKTSNTETAKTEVHIASAASNFQAPILQTGTTFPPSADGTWQMVDYDGDGVPDLIFIKTSNTETGKTEVHIASAASSFQTRILETGTTFPPSTDGTWQMVDYDGDHIPDLAFIKTSNTETGKTEVHIASAASNFQTRILETGTTFPPSTDGAWQMVDYDGDHIPDLVFIKTSNTETGKTEVHIASARP